MAHPDKRSAFDKAMAELQSKMYLVKIGEFYDPFTFLWDVVERRFSEEIKLSQHLDEDAARQNILQRYFDNVWVSNPLLIKRLFGWEFHEIENTLRVLISNNSIVDDVKIEHEQKLFYASSRLK